MLPALDKTINLKQLSPGMPGHDMMTLVATISRSGPVAKVALEQSPPQGRPTLAQASCGPPPPRTAPIRVLVLSCNPLPAGKLNVLQRQLHMMDAEVVNPRYVPARAPCFFPTTINVSSLLCADYTHILYVIQDPKQVNLHATELRIGALHGLTAPPQLRLVRGVNATTAHFASPWATVFKTNELGRDTTGCPDHLQAWLVTDMPVNMLFLDAGQFETEEGVFLLYSFLLEGEDTRMEEETPVAELVESDEWLFTNPVHTPITLTPTDAASRVALDTFDRVMDNAYKQMQAFHRHVRLAHT
jgi:hypothetical protein